MMRRDYARCRILRNVKNIEHGLILTSGKLKLEEEENRDEDVARRMDCQIERICIFSNLCQALRTRTIEPALFKILLARCQLSQFKISRKLQST